VIQGGDPSGTGQGGPGYQVVEKPPANLQYAPGVVAMAKTASDPDGASGSQFFIVTGTATSLPPQYALVGKVVSGQTAVNAIAAVPTNPRQDGAPTTPVVISRATVATR
jgi:cyclophilin family peptidyl-prolyl cis-trans isomerase